MAVQCSQDIELYIVPKPDGLIVKILTNQTTRQDFVDYDEQLSRYLQRLGQQFETTDRAEIKRFYEFLSVIIQQFKEFLTYVCDSNFEYSYTPDRSYINHTNNDVREFFFMSPLSYMLPAKFALFENEHLPLSELKLCVDWLTTIIEMEETFSPVHSLFSVYEPYLTDALVQLQNNDFL